jgi:hypothetical protein
MVRGRCATISWDYLDEACADEATLRQRIEELLQASEVAGGFLESPASDPAVTLSSSLVSMNWILKTSIAQLTHTIQDTQFQMMSHLLAFRQTKTCSAQPWRISGF